MVEDVCQTTLVDKENVEYVKQRLAGEKRVLKVSEFFKAVSDPARIRIVEALSIKILCVCDLAHLLGLSQSATSHHLRTLRDRGIVRYEKMGKMVYYSLDDEHVTEAFKAVFDHALHSPRD